MPPRFGGEAGGDAHRWRAAGHRRGRAVHGRRGPRGARVPSLPRAFRQRRLLEGAARPGRLEEHARAPQGATERPGVRLGRLYARCEQHPPARARRHRIYQARAVRRQRAHGAGGRAGQAHMAPGRSGAVAVHAGRPEQRPADVARAQGRAAGRAAGQRAAERPLHLHRGRRRPPALAHGGLDRRQPGGDLRLYGRLGRPASPGEDGPGPDRRQRPL